MAYLGASSYRHSHSHFRSVDTCSRDLQVGINFNFTDNYVVRSIISIRIDSFQILWNPHHWWQRKGLVSRGGSKGISRNRAARSNSGRNIAILHQKRRFRGAMLSYRWSQRRRGRESHLGSISIATRVFTDDLASRNAPLHSVTTVAAWSRVAAI